MRTVYGKLVRDRIPEIIRVSGRTCESEVMSWEEYRRALLAKLVEEAREAEAAGPAELARELADLQEVIDAVLEAFVIPRQAVEGLQEERRRERGGFQGRVRLLWSE
jgi:predicted house-cleaning noncanonical NTP pyrophosphatase (MazG superfamily)